MSNCNGSKQLDDYFTVTKAAQYIGVSVNTLRNWDKAGKVLALRHPVNSYRLYSVEDLNRLLISVKNGAGKTTPHGTLLESADDSPCPPVKSEQVK